MLRWLPRLAVLIFVALVGGGAALSSYFTPAQAQTPETYFPETGHLLRGSFGSYWRNHGGLALQGYPITEEFTEINKLNGKSYTVQYFERAIFELHPENKPPYDVLLTQLGTFRYQQKYPTGAPGQAANPNSPRFFKETGHSIGGSFRPYWESHGGIAQLGYPLSDEFREKSNLDGKTYTVQYFERAVLEWHPENKAPYNILLSQLGKFELDSRYPDNSNPAARRVNPPTTGIGGRTTFTIPIPAMCNDVPGDTALCISSEPGDPTGDGRNTIVTTNESVFNGKYFTGLNVSITGDDSWELEFEPPAGKSLGAGLYQAYPYFNVPTADSGLISVRHSAADCDLGIGRFEVIDLAADPTSGKVTRLAIAFEHRCKADEPGLRGVLWIHSTAGRKGAVPTLVPTQTPAPPERSAACDTVPGITYLCLEYQGKVPDYIKRQQIWTSDDVLINGIYFSPYPDSKDATLHVTEGAFMDFVFAAPPGEQLAIGRYDRVVARYRSANRPFLDISGGGVQICSYPTGRFEILDFVYNQANSQITQFAVNFEVQCSTDGYTLLGSLHLNSNGGRSGPAPTLAPTQTPQPVTMSTLCQGVPGDTYLCLDSPSADLPGGGRSRIITTKDATISGSFDSATGESLQIKAAANESWYVYFAPPLGQKLAVGRYDRTESITNHRTLRPGFTLDGGGPNRCSLQYGRFEILDLETEVGTHRLVRFAANFMVQCGNDASTLVLGTVRLHSNAGRNTAGY